MTCPVLLNEPPCVSSAEICLTERIVYLTLRWAQTGSNNLAAWGASLVYDTQLQFGSISHPLYTTVLTNTAVLNAVNITGSGGSGGISGWFLASTISFSILPAAAGLSLQISMPAILNNAMTNSVPIT